MNLQKLFFLMSILQNWRPKKIGLSRGLPIVGLMDEPGLVIDTRGN